jgi:tRNA pseudouridine32 synthase/23S rRNA pseudouridine746 synthase
MEERTFMGGLCEPDAIRVLHSDAHLVVVDKPAGLLSVPGRGGDKQDCVAARVQRLFADALVVHRLDMATSGLFLMARGADVQRSLSIAFAGRDVHKRYVAIVGGLIADEQGTINLPLIADWPRRPLQMVDHDRGKPSLTRWRVLERDTPARTTRVELEPVTGRSHQLRVHLSAIGHPILGDALYAPQPVQSAAARLMLHATRLELAHPATGDAIAFDSPAPF